ncbi:MAG: hypothetical protein BEN18_07555 [Epulopiscium sp. Nuni2H_MBin001]|nr:MAG: hypothetical protein BEN18_07555 [Epulopiscium sp. Nuni2H_MBin001]
MKKTKKQQAKQNQKLITIAAVGVAVLVITSLFTDQVGMLGIAIKTIFAGLFGIGGYILPFYAIYLSILNARHGIDRVLYNLVQIVPAILLLMVTIHVANYDSSIELATYLTSANLDNGGFVGGVISKLLLTLIGLYGTCIVISALTVMWFVCVFNNNFIGQIKSILQNPPQKKTVKKTPSRAQKSENLDNLEKPAKPVKQAKPAKVKPALAMPVLEKPSKTKVDSAAQRLEDTLLSFGVEAKVLQINKGPTVTRYELQPKQGVKVSKILNLADDIALNLAASGIRIEAPIPGKSAVGIEIPNEKTEMVYLIELLGTEKFKKFPSKVAFAIGKDIAGETIIADIATMPHLLIAGATGSGKSVCINTLVTSILCKSTPQEVRLIMIDPKVVELSIYNGIPHLLVPVVTEPKKASGALNWAVEEMDKRYNLFSSKTVRDIKSYNEKVNDPSLTIPQIVIIIDELADLMMSCSKEVEDSICRLAQKARAAGIHLIIATQRPSVDVITGVIKANIPSRLAFAVSSGIDSRTILDMNGAEKLLGKGDMLFNPMGAIKPLRVQGAYISDKEVLAIVEDLKARGGTQYSQEVLASIEGTAEPVAIKTDDMLIDQATNLISGRDTISIATLQTSLGVSNSRASKVMNELELLGLVSPGLGIGRPRKVLNQLHAHSKGA